MEKDYGVEVALSRWLVEFLCYFADTLLHQGICLKKLLFNSHLYSNETKDAQSNGFNQSGMLKRKMGVLALFFK